MREVYCTDLVVWHMKFRMGKAVKIGVGIGIILLAVVMLILFYTFDPAEQPLFMRCPFLLLTGYECPGCGSQRAIHSLLHFDFRAALHHNALMVPAVPYVLIGAYLQCFGGSKRHPKIEKIFFGRWSALTVLLLILAFWIGRNLL